mgnify:CR=1 FL=1
MYNKLVERCFQECVEDMRSKALTGKEEQVRADDGGRRAGAGGGAAESNKRKYATL